MPTLSWSALYGANSALSYPGASPDDCACLPRALFATASRARQRSRVIEHGSRCL
jgi:hypothetical protein